MLDVRCSTFNLFTVPAIRSFIQGFWVQRFRDSGFRVLGSEGLKVMMITLNGSPCMYLSCYFCPPGQIDDILWHKNCTGILSISCSDWVLNIQFSIPVASDIPHPEAFVHNFLEPLDIICNIGQNKNTLGAVVRGKSTLTDSDRSDLFSRIRHYNPKSQYSNYLPC